MRLSRIITFVFACSLATPIVACSSDAGSSDPNGTGGVGGAGGAGGAAANAGTGAGGSPLATGGAGAAASGGSAGAAGVTGGSSGSGGSPVDAGGSGASDAGMPDASGTTDGGDSSATRSEGCGTTTPQQTSAWVESMLDVNGTARPYSSWLPNDYDPERAYPVVFLLHGCGSGTNNLPMERETGSDAIVVRGTGSDGSCWSTDANGSDVALIDAMVADVNARLCADTSRLFVVGYSSGSWLANQLGCIRAEVFRGLATVAGGLPGVMGCAGPIAHMFVHDQNDMDNQLAWNEPARDRLLETNACDESLEPLAIEPSPCVSYQGCDPAYPVVWCVTSGHGHDRQDDFAAPAFWDFFRRLSAD